MRPLLAFLTLLAPGLLGCSSDPLFRLDPALRATPAMRVTGGDTQTPACPGDKPATREKKESEEEPAKPFEAGRRVAFGDTEAVVESVVRQASATHLVTDATLRGLRAVRQRAGQAREAAQLDVALNVVPSETDPVQLRVKVKAAASAQGATDKVIKLLDAITSLAEIPVDARQQMSFALRVQRGDRTIGVSCASIDVLHVWELFPGPDFSLTCALVPVSEEPGPRWSFDVRAQGTWRSYRYTGVLTRLDTPTRLAFADQSYELLGASFITGFELSENGQQQAALTQWGLYRPHHPESARPHVWLAPGDETTRDLEAATMAIAHLYPWPVPCSGSSK